MRGPSGEHGVCVTLAVIVVIAVGGLEAHVARANVGFVVSAHFGWKVDESSKGNACAVASADRCRPAVPSHSAGGFIYPGSVATDPRTGNIYVADIDNYRVQEMTAAGAFLSMFGWDVNKTKDRQRGATQAEKNVCTAASGDLCTAGVPGTAAGQLSYPSSVAVDPVTG
ncbi:MAG: hypothetical protein WAN93_05670, partial [Solirubrobacteraceae bacterium]